MDRICIFFWDPASLWGEAIKNITDGPWAHTGVIFEPDGQPRYCSEAIIGSGVTHSTMSKLRSQTTSPLVVVPLDPAAWNYTEAQFQAAFAYAKACEGHEGYGIAQILEMWAASNLGTPVTDDPNRAVCSTHVCRVLATGGIYDVRDTVHNADVLVSPNSAWRRIADRIGGLSRWTAIGATFMTATDPLLQD